MGYDSVSPLLKSVSVEKNPSKAVFEHGEYKCVSIQRERCERRKIDKRKKETRRQGT